MKSFRGNLSRFKDLEQGSRLVGGCQLREIYGQPGSGSRKFTKLSLPCKVARHGVSLPLGVAVVLVRNLLYHDNEEIALKGLRVGVRLRLVRGSRSLNPKP